MLISSRPIAEGWVSQLAHASDIIAEVAVCQNTGGGGVDRPRSHDTIARSLSALNNYTHPALLLCSPRTTLSTIAIQHRCGAAVPRDSTPRYSACSRRGDSPSPREMTGSRVLRIGSHFSPPRARRWRSLGNASVRLVTGRNGGITLIFDNVLVYWSRGCGSRLWTRRFHRFDEFFKICTAILSPTIFEMKNFYVIESKLGLVSLILHFTSKN